MFVFDKLLECARVCVVYVAIKPNLTNEILQNYFWWEKKITTSNLNPVFFKSSRHFDIKVVFPEPEAPSKTTDMLFSQKKNFNFLQG